MKDGRTLTQLAMELERQKDVKKDFVADSRKVAIHPPGAFPVGNPEPIPGVIGAVIQATEKTMAKKDEGRMVMDVGGTGYPVNDHALAQIGAKLNIPAKFVQRLAADHPDMLAFNINELFKREPKGSMIRTLDGRVRAFLSDRFRPLDNFDLANAALPHLIKHNAQVESCEVTESRMYIKAIRPDLVAELPPPPGAEMGKGHTFFVEKVQGAICLSNSEIGSGRLAIQPGIFTKRCTNLAVFADNSYFKVHLGSKTGGKDADKVWEFYSDATKRQADALVWNQVNDLVSKAMDGTIFNKIVQDLIAARSDEMTKPVPEVMEVTEKKFGFSQEESGGILSHLIKGGDLSRYGLHAAVTRYSQDVADYDRATELEVLGGQIIEMKPTEWANIARAA